MADHVVNAAARDLRFQIPQRAVNRIACRTGRQQLRKPLTRQLTGPMLFEHSKLREHRFRRFVVSRIRNGLATTDPIPKMSFDDGHDGLRLRTSGDTKRPR
jgi:hypothetical protein